MKFQQKIGAIALPTGYLTAIISSVLTLNMLPNVSLADAPMSNCEDLTTTIEQKQCYQKTYNVADKKLNQVYSQLKNSFKNDESTLKERQKTLTSSQQAWMKFRDTNCIFRSSGWGGTTRAKMQVACLERMTEERTRELQEMLNN
jgi:uncharacterized protein YecT (DUF1311 family)